MRLSRTKRTDPYDILEKVRESANPEVYTVNFDSLITSMEIAVLIEAGKKHKDKFGERLSLQGLSEQQTNIFKILKITDILEV